MKNCTYSASWWKVERRFREGFFTALMDRLTRRSGLNRFHPVSVGFSPSVRNAVSRDEAKKVKSQPGFIKSE